MDPITIMLVEDHVLLREGTRELLDREDDLEVVAEAGDGDEAVRLAEMHRPDVIVMDIALPGSNGLEATRRIKAVMPDAIILVLTAYDDDQFVFAFLAEGAAGYLLKDISATELIESIRAVHAGEPALHPTVAKKVIEYFAKSATRDPPTRDSGHEVDLTEREKEILVLAARGLTNAGIANDLGISSRTVQVHLSTVFGKLGVGSRIEAVLRALRRGLFTLEDVTSAGPTPNGDREP
jgi:DNA-binding NarL/FixJ family response regulator